MNDEVERMFNAQRSIFNAQVKREKRRSVFLFTIHH